MSDRRPVLTLCLLSSLLGGLAGGWMTSVRSVTAEESAVPASLMANEFRLVDRAGQIRALLSFTTDGEPSLSLKDLNDVTRVWVGIGAETGTAIRDMDGKTRAVLSVDGNGFPSLVVRDRNRQMSAFQPGSK